MSFWAQQQQQQFSMLNRDDEDERDLQQVLQSWFASGFALGAYLTKRRARAKTQQQQSKSPRR